MHRITFPRRRWRPCCGSCRGERLRAIYDQRPCAAVGAQCEDCGASWDGSELTVSEAADRPPAPKPFLAEA